MDDLSSPTASISKGSRFFKTHLVAPHWAEQDRQRNCYLEIKAETGIPYPDESGEMVGRFEAWARA